jgi:hypothetical protein
VTVHLHSHNGSGARLDSLGSYGVGQAE